MMMNLAGRYLLLLVCLLSGLDALCQSPSGDNYIRERIFTDANGGAFLESTAYMPPTPPKPPKPRVKTVKTDYCDNVIYQDGKLSQILVDGGYITFSGTTPVYHYYLKDHLGNNRVVAKSDGTVEQVNHYYPFGGLMAESTGGDIQRYKYNGKELDRMFGLDWYDYGARHYDGARAQFTTFDPLAEKDYGTSPYAYCGNAPMIRVDKDGRIWDTVIDVAFVAYDLADAGTQYLNTGSVSSTTKAALAADALAAVIPGVTGAGLAVRAGEKAANVTKSVGRSADVAKIGKYSNVPNPRNVTSGGKFTPKQKKNILDENRNRNGGVLKSDISGKKLDNPTKSRKGVKANMNQAEIDHIQPRSKEGTNSSSNAQVLSKEENLKKGNKF